MDEYAYYRSGAEDDEEAMLERRGDSELSFSRPLRKTHKGVKWSFLCVTKAWCREKDAIRGLEVVS